MMNNFDKIDKCIEKFIGLPAGSTVVVNGRWQCKTEGDSSSSKWTKDINSPSMMSEIHVRINDLTENGENLEGVIAIQSDMSLSHKYYGELCVKRTSAASWQKMFTIIDIDFMQS